MSHNLAILRESLALGLPVDGSPRQIVDRLLSYKRAHQLRAAAKVRALSLKRRHSRRALRKLALSKSKKGNKIKTSPGGDDDGHGEIKTKQNLLETDKVQKRPIKKGKVWQTSTNPKTSNKKTSRVKTTKKTGRKGVLQKLSMTPLPSAAASAVSKQRLKHLRLKALLVEQIVKNRTPLRKPLRSPLRTPLSRSSLSTPTQV